MATPTYVTMFDTKVSDAAARVRAAIRECEQHPEVDWRARAIEANRARAEAEASAAVMRAALESARYWIDDQDDLRLLDAALAPGSALLDGVRLAVQALQAVDEAVTMTQAHETGVLPYDTSAATAAGAWDRADGLRARALGHPAITAMGRP